MKRLNVFAWCCCVVLFGAVPAGFAQVSFLEEARSGIDLLENGQAADAEKALERAIDQAIEDDVTGENRARTFYNLGLSKLRQGKFEPAVASFDSASNESTDPMLQAKTYHNAGTSLARYAEGVADGSAETELPEGENPLAKASTVYEEALNYFRKSLLLDPSDTDTKGSYEVTRKAKEAVDEALRQQQEEQESDDKQESDDEDQSEEQQDSESGKENQDSEDGEEQNPESSDNQENSENNPDGDPQDDPGDEQQPGDSEDGEEEDPQDAQSNTDDGEEPSEEESSSEAREAEAQQMTQEEAELLLDKIKQDENAQRVRARPRLGKPQKVDKDW